MEMTIKQLAVELGVSKTTISKVISQLGFQNTLRKVGNKYILSETQISQIKTQISQAKTQISQAKTQISQAKTQISQAKT